MFRYMRLTETLSIILSIFLLSPAFGETVEFIDNGRGPVPLYVPSTYDGSTPLPLIISLHGYSDPGVESYFDFAAQVDGKNFLYCAPEGTTDAFGSAFWNGTDACCDFLNTNVDDSGYLRQLIELIQAQYAVDELSIHFTGISNGGFMSYRMACEHADIVASVAPLAGTTFLDDADCNPSEPVHILHVHGTSDSTISYDGGCIVFSCYPGAEESVSAWIDYNGCDSIATDGGPAFNLDWSVGGNETTSTIYQQNCGDGITVELWKMTGSEHVPNFRRGGDPRVDNLFANRAIDWLLDHRKPGSAICTGDMDNSGTIDIIDLLTIIDRWGDPYGTIELLSVLDNWGDCP